MKQRIKIVFIISEINFGLCTIIISASAEKTDTSDALREYQFTDNYTYKI